MNTPLVAPSYDDLLSKGLAGPNILLNGESGTGKTFILGTLVEWAERNGYQVFILDIENSLETLLGYWRDVGMPPFMRKEPTPVPSCLHWRQVHMAPVSLTQMVRAAKDTGDLSYELLTKSVDNSRGGANNSFWKILSECANFIDDRTGKEFGPIDKFDNKKIFVLDGFTELSNAAFKMQIGSRPSAAPNDYGVAQNHIMNFLRLCTHGTPMTFVMISHPARDKDEVTGTVNITVKTVGTAIQPQITPLFSDVLYAVRKGDQFTWSTAEYGVVAKTRYLGYKAGIKPDFGQIMDLWLKRGGK